MPYVDPQTVLSPRARIRQIIEVLHDGGANSWSAAVLDWDGERQLGLRWNGGDDSAVGNPQSRGQATWFIVPEELAQPILARLRETRDQALTDGYREMVSDAVRESEAEEWCEAGLEDDITD